MVSAYTDDLAKTEEEMRAMLELCGKEEAGTR